MENNTGISTFRKNRKLTNAANMVVEGLNNVPPHYIEMEQAVLGAMMVEQESVVAVLEMLSPDVFYQPSHRVIFEAVVDLFKKSSPIDLYTLNQELKLNGNLEIAGGTAYLSELTLKIHNSSNIEAHARILVELFMKRTLIEVSGKIRTEAFDDTSDALNLMDKAEQEIFALTERMVRNKPEKVSALLKTAIDEMISRKDQVDGLTGVPSGLISLDRVTNGWQPSDLIIIAARPGMGKTAFVISATRNAAVNFNKSVAIFSLEMSKIQLVNRLISNEVELDSEAIKTGKLTPEQWERVHHRLDKLAVAPIFIDDTPGLSILELRSKARKLKAQHKIDLLIIDYLQLMVADSNSNNSGNRQEEVSKISRGLKALSKELNIPVIALSQLSRDTEKNTSDKRPQLSHLRESGAIEQDADIVAFLFRPEYYGITEDETGNSTKGMAEFIIAKFRNGSPGTVQLGFQGKYTKFVELSSLTADYSTFGGNSFSAGNGGFGGGAFPNAGNIPSEFGGGSSGGNTLTLGSKMNDGGLDASSFTPTEDIPF